MKKYVFNLSIFAFIVALGMFSFCHADSKKTFLESKKKEKHFRIAKITRKDFLASINTTLTNHIELENGVILSISWTQSNILNQWKVGDKLIIKPGPNFRRETWARLLLINKTRKEELIADPL